MKSDPFERSFALMGRTADYSKQSCSIAAAMQVVGDPWTLLIVRDAFGGTRRFEQWQEHLGVARNVLASRLKRLVADGVMEARLYSHRPPRREYVLTKKGRDLYPVLMTMLTWGERHLTGACEEGPRFKHAACGQPFRARIHCEACGEPTAPHELILVSSPDMKIDEDRPAEKVAA